MDETILLNYLQGECNDEEAARVETWCEEEPGNRKTLEQLYYTLFVGERIAVMNAVDTEASLDKFKSAIREKERNTKQKYLNPLGALCYCGCCFSYRTCFCRWNCLGITFQ